MEGLIKKIEGILDQYFREEVGNRLSQFSFRSLKQIVLGEIANYKPNDCKPIVNKAVDKTTEQKIIPKIIRK